MVERTVAHGDAAASTSERGFRLGLGAVLAFNLLLAAFLLLAPVAPARLALIDNLAQALGPLAVILVGVSVRRSPWRGFLRPGAGWRRDDFRARAPLFLALGCVSWACGQLTWTFYEQVLHRPVPLGSWSDLGFLAAYPLLLAGILGLPRQPLSLATRARLVLDGLLIALTVAAYSWYFSLGPTLLRSDQSPGIKVLTAAYPLCDLALLTCLLWTGLRPGNPALRAVTRLLTAGLLLIIAGDSIFQVLVLRGSYATGTPLDVGWPLGYMLIGLAALGAQFAPRPGSERAPMPARDQPAHRAAGHPPFWRTLLPYLPLPVVGLLLAYAWRSDDPVVLERGLSVIGVALIATVIAHQLVVIRENWLYARDLDSVYRATLGQMEELDRLQRLATTDPLTGLHNRRALDAALDAALDRAAALGSYCAVLLLDLDRFKALNDTHGHLAGDAALRDFAALLRERQRGEIRAGRWGGEEFLLILPAADEIDALDQAEALRAAVAAHICAAAGGIRFTCSIGVAVFPQDATSREDLIAAADRAMYTAKCLGRNQVFSAADPAVATLMADTGETTSRGEEALAGTVEALAALVKVRDQYSGQQMDEIARLTVRVALALGCGFAEAHQIGIAARLHDVGKVTIPDAILRKAGALTAAEWAQMRLHPVSGAAIVGRVPGLRFLEPLIRSHHERWDGSGYPDGLSGDAIPLGARIIAATEAYGALTANRPYRAGRPQPEALAELRRCAGTQFDPRVVTVLEKVLTSSTWKAEISEPVR
jgi:diguanylate cyclase (GGDEF)-like protein